MNDEFCDLCGRNLTAMGRWADFTHYRVDDRSVPCLRLPDPPWITEMAEEMMTLARKIIEKMDKEKQ